MSFLVFMPTKKPERRVTEIWLVFSAGTPTLVGRVLWHSPWRRYVFEPSQNTIFDPKCLNEVVQFLERETQAQREKVKV